MESIIFHCFSITTAMKFTLPSRQELVNKLTLVRTVEELHIFVDEIVEACNNIERITAELYKVHDLTNLP